MKSVGKRLNLNLSAEAYNDVLQLSKTYRRSMTEIVRLALGLLKLQSEEHKRGHKLIVADSDGQQLKEIVIPL
jgi:hypothetical protein